MDILVKGGWVVSDNFMGLGIQGVSFREGSFMNTQERGKAA